MAHVYLALGANEGDAIAHISQAVAALSNKLTNVKRAPLYRSKAVGYTDQADFINTAISGETDLSPVDLLSFIKTVEQQIGRIARFRWGPREIDIDIIFYDTLCQKTPTLTIPHPRFIDRDFVLRPLVDLNPSFVDPRSNQSVSTLLANLPANTIAIVSRVDLDS